MIIGILSDTHDQLARTRLAMNQLREAGAEVLIHCGDFVGAPILLSCCVLPSWFVFGNNDSAGELELAAADTSATCLGWGGIVEFDGKRIGVTHGHLTGDVRSLLGENPDFLLTGHSHIAADSMAGTVRRINPGALHRAFEFTVALLNLESGDLPFLPVQR